MNTKNMSLVDVIVLGSSAPADVLCAALAPAVTTFRIALGCPDSKGGIEHHCALQRNVQAGSSRSRLLCATATVHAPPQGAAPTESETMFAADEYVKKTEERVHLKANNGRQTVRTGSESERALCCSILRPARTVHIFKVTS